jgi:hypothetical protein
VRAVALQAEAGGAVPAQGLDLGETVVVKQEFDAFPSGQLAPCVLTGGGVGARTLSRPFAQGQQLGQSSTGVRPGL